MTSQTHISSLYVLKAWMSLGVVILHAPLGSLTEPLRLLASITVPIFFMITGYFLYSESSEKMQKKLTKSIRKIALLVLILNFLLYPLCPIEGSFRDSYMLYFNWIFLGQTPGAGHLWYLTALLEGLVVLWLWMKLFKGRVLWIFLPLWLVQMVLGDWRMFLFGSPESMMNANFIGYALPCVTAGILIHKYEAVLLEKRHWMLWVVISVCLMYLNWFLIPSPLLLRPILRTAMILSFFMLALQHKSFGLGGKIEYWGQALSGNIYYFHSVFILLMEAWIGYEIFGAVWVFIASSLWALIIVKVQDRFGWNILR